MVGLTSSEQHWQGPSADDEIRAQFADLPAPQFGIPTTTASKLQNARVAIVTTAGLRSNGDIQLWKMGDTSFTILPSDARDLQLSHIAPNLDRVGVVADLNVVYPVDRLDELAARHRVGSVNERHLSFMGAQMDLTTLLCDTGPAAAELLVNDGVDVVLLTPV
jgi:D-proline reductase (dithiol) PrdB